jgi:outer membrane protein TolC
MKLTNLLNNFVYTIKLNIIVGIILFPLIATAQPSRHVTLDSLQAMARERYPYSRQLLLAGKYGEEDLKSVNANWLPQFALSGKATVQSEVTAISLPASLASMGISMEKGDKGQYQGELSFTQLLYDGGIIKASKEISRLNSEIRTEGIQTAMIQVESAVNILFESILVGKEQLKILAYKKTDLEARRRDLSSATQNGMALQTVLQELNAEIMGIEQKISETKAQLCDLRRCNKINHSFLGVIT